MDQKLKYLTMTLLKFTDYLKFITNNNNNTSLRPIVNILDTPIIKFITLALKNINNNDTYDLKKLNK